MSYVHLADVKVRALLLCSCAYTSLSLSSAASASHMHTLQFRVPVPTQQSHLRGAATSPTASQDSLDPAYRVVLRSNTPDSKLSGFQNPSQSVPGRHVTVHPHHTSKSQWFARHSSCALELDVAAANVLNSKLFRSLQQTSLEANGALPNVPSLAAIWEVRMCLRVCEQWLGLSR